MHVLDLHLQSSNSGTVEFDRDKESEIFTCINNCGRRYKSKYSLKSHLKYECGVERKFKCQFCGKMFTQKGSLKTHIIGVHKKIFYENLYDY